MLARDTQKYLRVGKVLVSGSAFVRLQQLPISCVRMSTHRYNAVGGCYRPEIVFVSVETAGYDFPTRVVRRLDERVLAITANKGS